MQQHNHAPTPHWTRRIHHSPIFWVGVLLFVAAISVYVVTDDLAWRPNNPAAGAQQPLVLP